MPFQPHVPVTVPLDKEGEYLDNFNSATKETGNLFVFAGDQKVEHLNDDYIGEGIPAEVNKPEHYFNIAKEAHFGVLAGQLGFISKYARDYANLPYLVKLNSKSNIVPTEDKDPTSLSWHSVEDVMRVKEDHNLNIVGVGYTVYIGSHNENEMLRDAAKVIYDAHQNGLIVVLWMYPRGKNISNEKDAHLIAGAAGVGLCLGADFVKVNYPAAENGSSAEVFIEATEAAGRTGVVCSGGSKKEEKAFFQELHDQIHISGARGTATGRNVYQRPLEEAIRMCNAVSAITIHGKNVEEAEAIFSGEKELTI